MTSIHIDSQPQAANGSSLNQSQTSNKFDEVERVRQRMDGLRKHHNESADIYNRTQPIINEQIHEETMKYLKNGQVNGTKTKSQKPRAPKRQRNAANNNSNNINNINNISNNPNSSPVIIQTNSVVNSTTNGIPPQANQIQHNTVPPQNIVQQQGHMQQVTLYPPRIQQQPMQHMQHPHQMQTQTQQQPFKYQTTNPSMYQQAQQPNMQAQLQYQTPQQQPQPSQPQQIYSQPMQPQTHIAPIKIEQNHFVGQHPSQQQPHQHFAQHHNHLNGNHHTHHLHHHHQQSQMGQIPLTSLPNDLDLTLQAGLECDVDSLIKHEMSVEGQLDFNHDLLLKLDNHYQPHHQ